MALVLSSIELVGRPAGRLVGTGIDGVINLEREPQIEGDIKLIWKLT